MADYRYRAKMGSGNHRVSGTKSQVHIIDSTHACGTCDDGIKHRLHIRRRAADDAEHFRCCSLMLQRLAQFSVTFLQFFEQPYIFNGDDCLIREGLEERDLFVRKRTDLSAADDNYTNR